MFDSFPFRMIAWMATLGFIGTFAGIIWLMYHLVMAIWNYIF